MSLGKKIGLGVGGGFLALVAAGTVLPEPSPAPAAAPAASPRESTSGQATTEPTQEPATQAAAEGASSQRATDSGAGSASDGSASSGATVATQEFTQPGDNPDADLAFTVMARMSPSIDADKGWSDRRILTLGGEAARMWENGASENQVASYLQDNGMTMLTSYYVMGGAISTYCSTDAVERFSD
jgi:hypothetical protein